MSTRDTLAGGSGFHELHDNQGDGVIQSENTKISFIKFEYPANSPSDRINLNVMRIRLILLEEADYAGDQQQEEDTNEYQVAFTQIVHDCCDMDDGRAWRYPKNCNLRCSKEGGIP